MNLITKIVKTVKNVMTINALLKIIAKKIVKIFVKNVKDRKIVNIKLELEIFTETLQRIFEKDFLLQNMN